MSSLWTPDGERPISRPSAEPGPPPNTAIRRGAETVHPPPAVDAEAVAEEVAALRADLARTPVEVVVGNHGYGLFELAAVYLSQAPPMLGQARLAIDALGCLVEGLSGRLGDSEKDLKDGLNQLRLAYVQIDGALRSGERSGEPPASSSGDKASDTVSEDGGGSTG